MLLKETASICTSSSNCLITTFCLMLMEVFFIFNGFLEFEVKVGQGQ